MDKKAQGLSLNTIIIAIIVLIVLVVIIMLFTGYFGAKFTPGVTSCENNGGSCQFASDDSAAPCGFDSFGISLAKLSGACPGEQICCSKGLGTGEAPEDLSKCGQEGQVPCPGNKCDTGLVSTAGGKCKKPVPCTGAGVLGCKSAAECGKTATGDCTEGKVCCAELKVVPPPPAAPAAPTCTAAAGCVDLPCTNPAASGTCTGTKVCCEVK